MTEHDRARKWRERLGLTKEQLSELTGYSRESIHLFEKGVTPARTWARSGKKAVGTRVLEPTEPVWTRYRNVCAGVQAQIEAKRRFAW